MHATSCLCSTYYITITQEIDAITFENPNHVGIPQRMRIPSSKHRLKHVCNYAIITFIKRSNHVFYIFISLKHSVVCFTDEDCVNAKPMSYIYSRKLVKKISQCLLSPTTFLSFMIHLRMQTFDDYSSCSMMTTHVCCHLLLINANRLGIKYK